MKTVFFTERRFPEQTTIDTFNFCEENLEVLSNASRTEQEVETFLEAFRQEYYPDAPPRHCSIVVIPWGTIFPKRKARAAAVERLRPLPGGIEEFCYFVSRKVGSKYRIADERWVTKLVLNWDEIQGSGEDNDWAEFYWNGVPLGGAPITLLFAGPVFIESECFEAAPEWEVVEERGPGGFFPGPPPRTRAEQIRQERKERGELL